MFVRNAIKRKYVCTTIINDNIYDFLVCLQDFSPKIVNEFNILLTTSSDANKINAL